MGGPLGWIRAGRNILAGRAMARELYRTFKPEAVIGFGGYPALPALLAAFKAGVPTAIHEQNAVLGRVNRLVARKVDAIATRSEEHTSDLQSLMSISYAVFCLKTKKQ